MISTTRRSPNATLVTKSAIDQAAEALQDLPEKTKEKLSLREAVDFLRNDISMALDKGYSYDDIAIMLAKQGVSIAPSSLKHYLARSNRQLKSKSTGTQTRRKRSKSEVELEAEETPEPVEATEAPKRGKRTKASAKATASEPTTRTVSKSDTATAPTRKRRTKASSWAVAQALYLSNATARSY